MTTTPPVSSPRRTRGRPLQSIVGVVAALVLTSSACTARDKASAPALLVKSDKAARAFVDAFFQAYVRTDLDSLREMLCEQDSQRLFRMMNFVQESQAPMSPYRVETFQVRSAAPVWIGRAPYFRVEVSFPRRQSPGQLLHVYRVNAAAGCLDGFLEAANGGPAVTLPRVEGGQVPDAAPPTFVPPAAPGQPLAAPDGSLNQREALSPDAPGEPDASVPHKLPLLPERRALPPLIPPLPRESTPGENVIEL